MVFLTFLREFQCTDDIGIGRLNLLSEVTNKDVRLVVERLGGKTFNDGLYRVAQADEIDAISEFILEGFPEFENRVTPFAFDWLGRVFAVDQHRVEEGHAQVVMIEFGAGEAMQIPCSAIDFHEQELINFADDALSLPFFNEWKSTHGEAIPYAKCVGYRTPLFLGGSDTLENLELSDRSVYWHFCGQLRAQAMSMRDGQKIGRIELP
ncbi:MAG: DUF1851 domain-containing protein [Planctomycetaceae bacterium]